jgi:hypothetical protein
MRFYVRDNEVEVVLSRRNLQTGLHKLEMPGSAREIQTEDGPPGMLLRLRFEDDGEHYAHPDRQGPPIPGPMLTKDGLL